MRITVETSFTKAEITQQTYLQSLLSEKKQLLSTEILNLKERSTIEALIQLGWTPPKNESN